MNEMVEIPKTGDAGTWTEAQKSLMEFAGLYKKVVTSQGEKMVLAPRSVVEAFAQTVARTQLDPIANQIYCIERGGKYTIQVGIDGARLIAQRTGEYSGQKPIQWTGDGVTWVDVWLADTPPAAARCGVMRQGFVEPLYAVATWKAFAPSYGGKLSSMWANMGAHMLGKCAEMLALRKAFPMELSGLYVAEEMAQADTGSSSATPSRDYLAEAKAVDDKAELMKIWQDAKALGELTPNLSAELTLIASKLTKDSRVTEVIEDAVIVEDEPAKKTK